MSATDILIALGAGLLILTQIKGGKSTSSISAPAPAPVPAAGATISFPVEPRPIIPVRMLLPSKTWSKSIPFNFDTGASNPTDIPLPLVPAFGTEAKTSSARKTFQVTCQIPGFLQFTIPCMLQDKAHYDLFRQQSNRYPLLKVRDLMPFCSIVYKQNQTILRQRGMAIPELSRPGVVRFPDASTRIGTPTSSQYWTRGIIRNPRTGQQAVDWMQINTGDVKFIIKQSLVSKIGGGIAADFIFNEAKPPITIKNASMEVRPDSQRFARGGTPRNLLGGPQILSRWNIVIWDNHRAMVPA